VLFSENYEMSPRRAMSTAISIKCLGIDYIHVQRRKEVTSIDGVRVRAHYLEHRVRDGDYRMTIHERVKAKYIYAPLVQRGHRLSTSVKSQGR